MIDNLNLVLYKKIICIYNVLVIEEDMNYELSDTIILEFEDFVLIQILMSEEGIIVKPVTQDSIVILGEYDLDNIEIKLTIIRSFSGKKIMSLISYLQSSYIFGSKFLDQEMNFIFGFCFGFDEVIIVDENEFKMILSKYEDFEEEILS